MRQLGKIALLSLAAVLLFAAPAGAGTVTDERPFLFAFDGAGSSIGPLSAPRAIAIDSEAGLLYVNNQAGSDLKGPGPFDAQRVVCRFDLEGNPVPFTAGGSAGKSCLDGKDTPSKAFGVAGFFSEGAFLADVAVDDSGGAGQGRFYVQEDSGPIHAFEADGKYRWTLASAKVDGKAGVTMSACGIAVGADGRLWVGNGQFGGETRELALEFDPSGATPPSEPSDEVPMTNGNKQPCRLGLDQGGEALYVGSLTQFDRYKNGVFEKQLLPGFHFDVAVDQSKADGHVFAIGSSDFDSDEFVELTSTGTKVSGSPFGGGLLGAARGIAYDPATDRVFISDDASDTIKVFGPVASGTVPDVSCQTTTSVGLHEATANCTINPLSLPHSYHFEWKEGTGANWGTAKSSVEQSIEPTDSNPHEVSFVIKKIKSATTHQVRLVGTNTENDLSAYSNADTFTTPTPPKPGITDCSVSAITTDSAHLACTIDPFAEETDWLIERSTDPACATGFVKEPTQTIPEGEAGKVTVQWDLEGLLAAQSYCVRIVAVGPGGTAESDDFTPTNPFKTLAVAPSEASAAFAAPRTDTTVRINARINPEGEADLEYRFELSADGGESWEALPIRTSAVDAREPIIVAEELSGLEPETEYSFRLALAKNEAGDAPSLGEEKEFTTRTTAELTLPPNAFGQAGRRGIELVNNPDKGNQNVAAFGPTAGGPAISADGEKVLWSVDGGAPGAPNGTLNSFLAERGAAGWSSQSVAPPAAEQIGGGELAYELTATTPDFESFVFNANRPTVIDTPEPPSFVRIGPGGEQELLKAYDLKGTGPYASLLDLSDDFSHALFVDAKTKQLEDIGTPGAPETVSLMPGGEPSQCGLLTEGQSFYGKTAAATAAGAHWRPGYHRIATTDASRVYFQARADGDCSGLLRLWVRNRESGQTIEIDPGASGQDPELIRATPDGRAAYFVTRSKLDPTDENTGGDVYRWDEAAGESTCLTCEATPNAGVSGRVLVSDDFSRIYFESEQKLVAGAGRKGDPNIYLLHEGELGFVATAPIDSDTKISADGETLLFAAPATPALTADAVESLCAPIDPEATVPEKCRELYRYEESEESLECLSCEIGGTTTHSVGTPNTLEEVDFKLSGDGDTAAFATQEGLMVKDVNQDTDIYEWRDGALRLISDGVSDFPSRLSAPQVVEIDFDGSDILFSLVPPNGRLTGFEQDGVLNLYDARIGGGFAPPPPDIHCVEDSCQGPLVPAPPLSQPASESFAGHGNPGPGQKPCRRGKVRRKGRCVSKRALARRACAKLEGKAKQRCVNSQLRQLNRTPGRQR